jgi:hypothetical protein
MKLTERKLRNQVRQVMLESYMDALEIEASDATRIESVWSKAVDIMESLENALIEKYSSKIVEELEQEIDYMADRSGVEPEDFKASAYDMHYYDPIHGEAIDIAARILEADQNFAQEMKRLNGIIKLVMIMFAKKSEKIADQGDPQKITGLAQGRASLDVRKSIGRLAAGMAVRSVLDQYHVLGVGDERTVRQRADSILYGVLQNVVNTAEYAMRYT